MYFKDNKKKPDKKEKTKNNLKDEYYTVSKSTI